MAEPGSGGEDRHHDQVSLILQANKAQFNLGRAAYHTRDRGELPGKNSKYATGRTTEAANEADRSAK